MNPNMLNLKQIIENDISLEEKVDQILIICKQTSSSVISISSSHEKSLEELENQRKIIYSIVQEMQANYRAYHAYVMEFAKRLKERDELIDKLNKYIIKLEDSEKDIQ